MSLKPLFQDISRALTELHRELLMREATKLESEGGRKISPYELLHASLYDPRLAWLRPMSALIVVIDTMIDEAPNLSGQEASQIANEVLSLLERPASGSDSDFWSKYSSYLSHDADVIMRHSKVKAHIASLRPKM